MALCTNLSALVGWHTVFGATGKQAQMYIGRSYADSPDVDGHVYFAAEKEVEPGSFIPVRITGSMDGDMTGEAAAL